MRKTADWNTDLYLKFEKQRTQPAMDLAQRVSGYHASKIADLGCGPGNSTAILKAVFPNAYLIGIDSSENMINKARSAHPDIKFALGAVQNLADTYDLIFSNACLQWIPNHKKLLPYLMSRLNDRGVLAVQVPNNEQSPLYKAVRQTAVEFPHDFSGTYYEQNPLLAPNEYYEILSKCSSSFEIWETIYYHSMPSHEELINWIKSTRLRPYSACLDENEQQAFKANLLSRIKPQYPITSDGQVIFKFKRLFFIAEK